MDNQKGATNKRRIIRINGTKINQSRTSYSSRQRYLDLSQQKYKPFVIRLGTTDKYADIQIPQDDELVEDSDVPEHYQKYFKIKRDMIKLKPKEFQKKYIWGGTRNPTHVKTQKARAAVISRRLRTNYDNYAYMHDVLDMSTVSFSGDPNLKELNLFCTEDLKQTLNTPLKQLPQLKSNTSYTIVTLISQILADIQSKNNAPQNLESEDESINDSEQSSEDDRSHSGEEEENGDSDRDVIMDDDEREEFQSSTIRSRSQQQTQYVTVDSKAWKEKLSKLKQTL
jgi:hypothetical protein